MKTEQIKMDEGKLIAAIMRAVNAGAEATKNNTNPTRKADANMFFELAFCSKDQLVSICKKAGVSIY